MTEEAVSPEKDEQQVTDENDLKQSTYAYANIVVKRKGSELGKEVAKALIDLY